MKIAVIGSRGIDINIFIYLSEDTSEIIYEGAAGVDQAAERHAKYSEILPITTINSDYQSFF